MYIHTLWEDYSELVLFKNMQKSLSESKPIFKIVDDDSNEQYFSDENAQKSQIYQDLYDVYVRIPEYYSYDIENNGDIMHEDRDVSSKMYGNLRAITPNRFIGKKLKTEIC